MRLRSGVPARHEDEDERHIRHYQVNKRMSSPISVASCFCTATSAHVAASGLGVGSLATLLVRCDVMML